ncbi:hypothetical protein [Actinoallomurus sp. CA-150999]|uniref:hypothetical protein n=1 Tax=Actinoallomurus sp. CA-150999 TaxID=3239887 RepID=UPI003D9332ED
MAVIGAILVAALTAVLTGLLNKVLDSGVSHVRGDDSAAPFAWTVRVNRDMCAGATHFRALASLPPRPADGPFGLTGVDSGTDAAFSDVAITFQGKTDAATVLQALHIDVVSRARPAGALVEMVAGCGGMLPRYFAVDLDRPQPRAVPSPGRQMPGAGPTVIPAVPFPYRISSTDPEVFHVIAAARSCDCRWRVRVDWTSGDRSGTVTIDDHGRPFRTVGTENVPVYTADGGRWERGSGPTPSEIPVR